MTSTTLVSMCILPLTSIMVASEAMAASKRPWRSHHTCELNSMTSISYVSMYLWPLTVTIHLIFPESQTSSIDFVSSTEVKIGENQLSNNQVENKPCSLLGSPRPATAFRRVIGRQISASRPRRTRTNGRTFRQADCRRVGSKEGTPKLGNSASESVPSNIAEEVPC